MSTGLHVDLSRLSGDVSRAALHAADITRAAAADVSRAAAAAAAATSARMRHVRETAATAAAPLTAAAGAAAAATAREMSRAKEAAERAMEATRAFTQAEARIIEARMRARFGGTDDSESVEKRRARQVARYRSLFLALAVSERGVPINDLEDAFGLAGLLVSRTEVGRLSYEADEDGNGALDFSEFTVVLDKLGAYQMKKGSALGSKLSGSVFYGTEGASLSLKQVVWRSLDDPAFSLAARIANIVLIIAILAAMSAFILSSDADIDANYHSLLSGVEVACVAIFSLEYSLKLLTAQPSLISFLTSKDHLFDVLTLVPYYVDLAYENSKTGSMRGDPTVRIVRVFRMLRIFKVMKYVPYVSLMSASASASAVPIAIALFVMMIGTLILSFGVYFAERGTWSPSDELYVQPDGRASAFQSIADSIYWSIITLTTVGYGDLFPITMWGQIVGGITAVMGTVIVAFPVSIYTEEFAKEYVESVKTKAIQAEMSSSSNAPTHITALMTPAQAAAAAGAAGGDLVERLLAARAQAARGPRLSRVPARGTLTAQLSHAVPHNLALLRRTRRSGANGRSGEMVGAEGGELVEEEEPAEGWIGAGTLAAPPPASSQKNDDSDRSSAAAAAATDAGTPLDAVADASARRTAEADVHLFHAVWSLAALHESAVDVRDPRVQSWDLGVPAAAYVWEDRQEGEGGKSQSPTGGSAGGAAPSVDVRFAPAVDPEAGSDGVSDRLLDDGDVLAASTKKQRLWWGAQAAAVLRGATAAGCSTEALSLAHERLRVLAGEARSLEEAIARVRNPPLAPSTRKSGGLGAAAAVADGGGVGLRPLHASSRHSGMEPSRGERVHLLHEEGGGAVVDDSTAFVLLDALPGATATAPLPPAVSSTSAPHRVVINEGGSGAAGEAAAAAACGIIDDGSGGAEGTDGDAAPAAPPPTLAGTFGFEPLHLTAASFAHYDLTQDAPLAEACLALLSDKRKQVWAAARLLESRFRDDLSIEISRRWQRWMGMPQEYVNDVAEPFIFRKNDLKRGLTFSRREAGLGFQPRAKPGADTSPKLSSSPAVQPPLQPYPGGGSTRFRSSSTAGSDATGPTSFRARTSSRASGGGGGGSVGRDRSHTQGHDGEEGLGDDDASSIKGGDGDGGGGIGWDGNEAAPVALHAQLRELLTAPSKAAAAAVLEVARARATHHARVAAAAVREGLRTGLHEVTEGLKDGVSQVRREMSEKVGVVRERMQAEFAHALDPLEKDPGDETLDYQARLREQYRDVLGGGGGGGGRPPTSRPSRRAGGGEPRSVGGRSKRGLSDVTSPEGGGLSSGASGGGGFGGEGVSGEQALPGALPCEGGGESMAAGEGVDVSFGCGEDESVPLVQTAFGHSVSLPLEHNRVSSSLSAGTASVLLRGTAGRIQRFFAIGASAPLSRHSDEDEAEVEGEELGEGAGGIRPP